MRAGRGVRLATIAGTKDAALKERRAMSRLRRGREEAPARPSEGPYRARTSRAAVERMRGRTIRTRTQGARWQTASRPRRAPGQFARGRALRAPLLARIASVWRSIAGPHANAEAQSGRRIYARVGASERRPRARGDLSSWRPSAPKTDDRIAVLRRIAVSRGGDQVRRGIVIVGAPVGPIRCRRQIGAIGAGIDVEVGEPVESPGPDVSP